MLKCGTTLREQSFGFYGGVGVGDGEGWGDFFFKSGPNVTKKNKIKASYVNAIILCYIKYLNKMGSCHNNSLKKLIQYNHLQYKNEIGSLCALQLKLKIMFYV